MSRCVQFLRGASSSTYPGQASNLLKLRRNPFWRESSQPQWQGSPLSATSWQKTGVKPKKFCYTADLQETFQFYQLNQTKSDQNVLTFFQSDRPFLQTIEVFFVNFKSKFQIKFEDKKSESKWRQKWWQIKTIQNWPANSSHSATTTFQSSESLFLP